MILYINYDINAICKKILQEQLDKLGLKYSLISIREVEIRESISEDKLNQLYDSLNSCNIEIVESQKSKIVQQIKEAIVDMIFMEEKLPSKTSTFLENKLKQRYGYLSNLFSSVTYTSIETFILMQKTERAKQLLAANELNITEIGWKLNYSSTAHFSHQFKSVKGLTPTAFQRILAKRRAVKLHEKY